MIATLLAGLVLMSAGDIPVKDGEKIAFLGDSITQGGMGATGYVTLVIQGLKANGVNATAIGAGISGHKSNDMLARLQRDVIDKKPDWMTLSCGVNDVLMQKKGHGVDLDSYKSNVASMVQAALARNVKVVLMTATPLGEDPANEEVRERSNEVTPPDRFVIDVRQPANATRLRPGGFQHRKVFGRARQFQRPYHLRVSRNVRSAWRSSPRSGLGGI